LARSAGSRAGALVAALAALAPRFSPEDRREKLRLLQELAGCPVRATALLARLHETLCFLQAYPDDAEVLARADRALDAFPARLARLGTRARKRLYDSGIVGTTLDYPFGLPMTRWLVSSFPAEVDVAWSRYTEEERLEEALSTLVERTEDDALTEGGLGWRAWLGAARGGRPVTGLQVLLELFDGAPFPEAARDWMFESLGLPIQWRPATLAGSRTGARLPWARPFFHADGLKRSGLDFIREVDQPLPSLRRAPPQQALTLIDAARLAVATRQRELHCFSYPNPDDVLVADVDRGLRIALFGLHPEYRLPLEGYYAFLVLKNGVPMGYGGAWGLFGTLELGFNIFESFRQGESAFILSQVLRAYRQVTGMRAFSVDPYQLGHDNTEALRSGAFYFYYRHGFRPRDPEALALAAAEQDKSARTPGYRSPLPVLTRLSRHHVYLILPGGDPAPEKRVRPSQVAALVTRQITLDFGGDRGAAVRACSTRVARALGIRLRALKPREERRAFERFSLVAALIPNLERWPDGARRGLARLLRAKGGRSEAAYFRMLSRNRRFRDSLAALVGNVKQSGR
jgi:hypothetical protein